MNESLEKKLTYVLNAETIWSVTFMIHEKWQKKFLLFHFLLLKTYTNIQLLLIIEKIVNKNSSLSLKNCWV